MCYKAFEPGLVCRGYRYHMGLNTTDEANCRKNGFHCAADPLDCLSYYPDINRSVYCIVDARGEIDEDSIDSKVTCTEMKIMRILSPEDYFLHILLYMAKHPAKRSSRVCDDRGSARNGYVIVRGRNPSAKGEEGDILAMLMEDSDGDAIQLAVHRVDGIGILPDKYYDIDGREVPDDEC